MVCRALLLLAVAGAYDCPPGAGPSDVYYTATFDTQLQTLTGNNASWPARFRFHFFDDAAQRDSMRGLDAALKDAGAPGAFDAYERLRPMAFKADLWRYAILWACGGWYVDAKLRLVGSVDDFLAEGRGDGLRVPRDGPSGWLWNGLLVAPAKQQDLLRTVKHVIANVESKRTFEDRPPGGHALLVSGPGALFEATRGSPTVRAGALRYAFRPRFREYGSADATGIEFADTRQPLFVQDARLHKASSGDGGRGYARLYAEGEAYCAGPCAPPPREAPWRPDRESVGCLVAAAALFGFYRGVYHVFAQRYGKPPGKV